MLNPSLALCLYSDTAVSGYFSTYLRPTNATNNFYLFGNQGPQKVYNEDGQLVHDFPFYPGWYGVSNMPANQLMSVRSVADTSYLMGFTGIARFTTSFKDQFFIPTWATDGIDNDSDGKIDAADSDKDIVQLGYECMYSDSQCSAGKTCVDHKCLSGAAPLCGNGQLDTGETCDDRNITSGDGCSSTCQIQSGYTCPVPGVACTDVNECTNGACSANATCINSPGSFTCSCKTGFAGDGVTCTDINECAAPTNPCGTQTCTNTSGGYTCTGSNPTCSKGTKWCAKQNACVKGKC